MKTLVITEKVHDAASVIDHLRHIHGKQMAVYDLPQDAPSIFASIRLDNGASYVVICMDYGNAALPKNIGKFDMIYLLNSTSDNGTVYKKMLSKLKGSAVKEISKSDMIEKNGKVRCVHNGCESWVKNTSVTWLCKKHSKGK